MSLMSQTNGPAPGEFYWNGAGGGGGGGGNVPSIVAMAERVYWTQQSWIALQSTFRPELGGNDTSNGSVVIPAAIVAGLANSNYTTLRIDSTFPILEDQGDLQGGAPGRYYQTALAAAGLDVSQALCFPATQFHMILDASGTDGFGTEEGIFLGNSCPAFPFSLVLSKANGNITISSALIEFQLSTTSSSNAKFLLGSMEASLNNICPMVFTLTA